MVWGRDHGALTLANGRRRGLESHQLHCEADIVACHPGVSVLDRALKLHVSLGEARQRLARCRRDVMHSEFFGALDPRAGALPPFSRVVAAVAVDENLPRAAASLADQPFVGLPDIDP